jgi:branched-chain amino acid transport system ATP-binding protein
VLRVCALTVRYGRVPALSNVSLDVDTRELVTVIGSNGAGKSTLLLTLSGILRASSGSIDFFGTRLDQLSPHEIVRAGVLHVPQGRQLFSEMTVLENLELGGFAADRGGRLSERLDEQFDRFPRLAERRYQKAGTLSGGEQQMLAIGRALMAKPRCLLLDEPSSGLAPIIVEQLAELIVDLNTRGTTILLVEQNADLALQLAGRAYVLENGRVIAEGASSDLAASDLVKKAYLGI